MTTSSNTAPLTAMHTSERTLTGAIDQAASALDRVATTATASALDRLHASAEAAKHRIAAVKQDLTATVESVLAELLALANAIDCDLSVNTEAAEALPAPAVEALPAPQPEPAPNPLAEALAAIDEGDDEPCYTTSAEPTTSEPTIQTTSEATTYTTTETDTLPDHHGWTNGETTHPASEPAVTIAANGPVDDAQPAASEPAPVQTTRRTTRKGKRS